MPATKAEIWNLALSNIGSPGDIVNPDTDNSPEARHCRASYSVLVTRALRDHDWSFASTFLLLADVGSPPTGWGYRYAYPADCEAAREIWLGNPDQNIPPPAFEVHADPDNGRRVILTNVQDATLRYTRRVDEPMFDSSFVYALSWLLAAHLSMSISKSRTRRSDALSLYRDALRSALADNLNEHERVDLADPEAIRARA